MKNLKKDTFEKEEYEKGRIWKGEPWTRTVLNGKSMDNDYSEQEESGKYNFGKDRSEKIVLDRKQPRKDNSEKEKYEKWQFWKG